MTRFTSLYIDKFPSSLRETCISLLSLINLFSYLLLIFNDGMGPFQSYRFVQTNHNRVGVMGMV